MSASKPALLPIEHAHLLIRHIITPTDKIEICGLDDLLGRALAFDITSPINVPSTNNAAMDGYAIRIEDLTQFEQLEIVGKSFAGNAFKYALKAGQCIRIMTGATIPDGANAVVMQENTETLGEHIRVTEPVRKHEAIRFAGNDIKQNAQVLTKGKTLTATDIGLLASLGQKNTHVFTKLTVAIFSTGDELIAPGKTLPADCIYDSNRAMLKAMLTQLNVDILDLGKVNDSKEAIKTAFNKADKLADCVITSGGVSVGEADYTREVLKEIGEIDFWKLAIKPGKPLAFGRLPNSIFFGLPGNPVSAAITFDQIVAPAIKYFGAHTAENSPKIFAKTAEPFRKKSGRTDFQRATYQNNQNNELIVFPQKNQSSGVLSSISKSNCYAVLERDQTDIKIGDIIEIIPFDLTLL